MRKLVRLAVGAAALALAVAGSSCGRQNAQQPQNQTRQPQAQHPEAQQAQNQPQHPRSQEPGSQQPQNEVQQPQAQQPQHEPEAQRPQPHQQQAQEEQNQGQPVQRSANENSSQSSSQSTAENPSPGQIRQIQRALEEKGFTIGRLDGKLGPRTQRALSQFQRRQGLQQTGVPDERTLAALGIGGGASTTGQQPSGTR